MVGPGIGRGEYGGFLMSLPARRMYDVWADPDHPLLSRANDELFPPGSTFKMITASAALQDGFGTDSTTTDG